MRNDFTLKTKKILANRVANRCSNPSCRRITCGPQKSEGAINIGVAAHITAASSTGPRFEMSITDAERKSIDNGIWLCQSCAKLIDNDIEVYTVEKLRHWKMLAEAITSQELSSSFGIINDFGKAIQKCDRLMPDLMNEMRQDLSNYPLCREFVLLKKSSAYNGTGNELVYYYDEHEQLDNKISVLLNNGLIRDVTRTNTLRYKFIEEFVDYLQR